MNGNNLSAQFVNTIQNECVHSIVVYEVRDGIFWNKSMYKRGYKWFFSYKNQSLSLIALFHTKKVA
jgi:hypothetical protein